MTPVPRILQAFDAVRRRVVVVVVAWAAAAMAAAPGLSAPVSARDDDGQLVSLPAPARRILSLSPHATELLFAAGAGANVVGTVRYADYPEAARRLPRVGDAMQLDLERMASLKPDLIVVWLHGSAIGQIERLKVLKVPVFNSEPTTLAQIGSSLRRLGTLAGTDAAAQRAADAFDAELAALRQRYAGRAPVRVFYQVWHQPLITVNDQHLIGDVIKVCGGVNVFGSQAVRVPMPSAEAVLAARPQVLVSSYNDNGGEAADAATLQHALNETLSPWVGFKAFEPVAKKQVLLLPADWISRQSPRALLAARRLCQALDQVRAGQAVSVH
jgi:iron complex transport system substrate-binding protein